MENGRDLAGRVSNRNPTLSNRGSRSSRSNRRGNIGGALNDRGSSRGGGSWRSGSSSSSSSSRSRLSSGLCVGLIGWAISGDMTGLRALIADLACRAQGPAIGGSTIARDVALGAHQTTYSRNFIKQPDSPACHKHSISWPELGNRERSGWGHHTCSRSQLLGIHHIHRDKVR